MEENVNRVEAETVDEAFSNLRISDTPEIKKHPESQDAHSKKKNWEKLQSKGTLGISKVYFLFEDISGKNYLLRKYDKRMNKIQKWNKYVLKREKDEILQSSARRSYNGFDRYRGGRDFLEVSAVQSSSTMRFWRFMTSQLKFKKSWNTASWF